MVSRILFCNLFVNDIDQYIVESNFLMFADDLKIFHVVKNYYDTSLLQNNVDGLTILSSINVLTCKYKKVDQKVSLISAYHANNEQLLHVTEIRDLRAT